MEKNLMIQRISKRDEAGPFRASTTSKSGNFCRITLPKLWPLASYQKHVTRPPLLPEDIQNTQKQIS